MITYLQHSLRLALELADALSGDAERTAQLREGRCALIVEVIATDQDVPIAIGEPPYSLAELSHLHLAHHAVPGAWDARSSSTNSPPRSCCRQRAGIV